MVRLSQQRPKFADPVPKLRDPGLSGAPLVFLRSPSRPMSGVPLWCTDVYGVADVSYMTSRQHAAEEATTIHYQPVLTNLP